MPMALALNVSPLTAVASFAAVSGLFILPTYPTLVAAVQMDDTGTTRIGKFVFNHPFFIGHRRRRSGCLLRLPAGQLYAVSVSPAGRITPRILPPFD